jgi:hypothetical protein
MTIATFRTPGGLLGAAIALMIAMTPLAAANDSGLADDASVQKLEARVAELEALVRVLAQGGRPEMPPAVTKVETTVKSEPTHAFNFGGYVKFDAMFSDYSAGDLAPASIGSQFYVPSTIPVGNGSGEGPDADVHMRETRFNFRSDHGLANGHDLTTFLELDFNVLGIGDERISNSYVARLRHAFIKYDNWLLGQTWTTFQDVAALPDNLDFIGPSEGTTFGRQAMIRYTSGAWEFAAENPESTITPFGGGSRIVTDDGTVPDLIARYTHKLANGYIKVAGMVRQLDYDIGNQSDTETGYGLSISGKHFFGDDDLRWMATYGSGIGRYIGLNVSNDAVLDASGNLNAIDQFGGFVSYRHFWDSQWHSNLTLSYLGNDNEINLTGTGVTKSNYSVHANLLYEPVPKFTVGAELIFAQREIESGLDGDLTRLMFSAKYGF